MERNVFNPLDLIPKIFKFENVPENYVLGHVQHDSNIDDYDYEIIRESTHDGTMLFSIQLLEETLRNIVFRTSYCTKDFTEEEFVRSVKEVNYIIGDLMVESHFGVKNINGMNMHGITETVRLAVKCEYVFK